MGRPCTKLDPLPEAFSSYEEAGRFWDTHSATDYWDQMEEVDLEVQVDRDLHLMRIHPQLRRALAEAAAAAGVSSESLLHMWLTEKLGQVTVTT